MTKSNPLLSVFKILIVTFFLTLFALYLEYSLDHSGKKIVKELILGTEAYHDSDFVSIKKQLQHRFEVQPFNLVALIIFAIAITHTFFARKITLISKNLAEHYEGIKPNSFQLFLIEFLHFMGEVEVILGFWVIPLLMALTYFFNWNTAIHYLNNISYAEPLFVVVVMAIASTNPILKFAEMCLLNAAKLGKSTVQSYWWTLLTLGPLLGSFITEAASMTICALLLAKQFYIFNPSKRFAYATLGLLFTNISVGGVLTNYAAPPVLMVIKAWGYSSSYMFKTFGIKAVFGIILSNLVYWLFFRSEFKQMEKNRKNFNGENEDGIAIPAWVTIVHLLFLAWVVIHLHYPVIFIGSFLLYLGFYKATTPFQKQLELQTPILVGFFLSGLIIHGNLQEWWLGPILQDASKEFLMTISLVLTAFNDNAQITFLASLIPNFSESSKYAILAGAVTGGGLTIIANAPNLVGQSFLKPYFPEGISALYLFLGAITPTLIMASIFYFFQPSTI